MVEIDPPFRWVEWENSALGGMSCSVCLTNVRGSKTAGKATETESADH
jgi:hypothetical protein